MAIGKQIRAVTSVAAIMAGLGTTLPAHAQMNMEALLEKLRDKGVLSEDEFKEMRQEAREARRAAAVEKATEKDIKEKAKVKITGDDFKDRFTFSSPDGENSIRLTGRVHADYRTLDDKFDYTERNNTNFGFADRDTASIADGFELRRARVGFSGFVYRDIGFEAVFNGVGGAPVVDTAFVNYGFNKKAQVRFGRFKQPFSLEELTSSNDIDFAERSYVNQNNVPGKKLGVMLHGEPMTGVFYGVSAFQQGFGEQTQNEGEGKRFAARLATNLAQIAGWKQSVVHLGVAGLGGDYEIRPAVSSQTSASFNGTTGGTATGTVVGFRSLNRGLNNIWRAQIGQSDTANLNNNLSEFTTQVRNNGLGLEGAVAYGPLKIQGEWTRMDYDTRQLTGAAGSESLTGDVKTYYVQALWNITGENWSDQYQNGVFRTVKVKNVFRPGGGWGAFQLGLRYSNIDVSDLTITGTTSNGTRIQRGAAAAGTCATGDAAGERACRNDIYSWGLGLNWILNPMSRVMFEWTRTDFGAQLLPLDAPTTGARSSDKEDLFSIRTQFNF
jgi:phosphate-selective porin OprO/OprP